MVFDQNCCIGQCGQHSTQEQYRLEGKYVLTEGASIIYHACYWCQQLQITKLPNQADDRILHHTSEIKAGVLTDRKIT